MKNRFGMPNFSVYFYYAGLIQAFTLNPKIKKQAQYKFLSQLWNNLTIDERQWYHKQDVQLKLEIKGLKDIISLPLDSPLINIEDMRIAGVTGYYSLKMLDLTPDDILCIEKAIFVVYKSQILHTHNVFCDCIHVGPISLLIKELNKLIKQVKTIIAKRCIILALIYFLEYPLVIKMQNNYPEFKEVVKYKMSKWTKGESEFTKYVNLILKS